MTRTRVVGVEGEVHDEDHGKDGGVDGRAANDARTDHEQVFYRWVNGISTGCDGFQLK